MRRDGFEIPIEDSVAPIHDREGQATGAVIVFRDVSAAGRWRMQITHLAEHDFLTGLPNRMLLNDRISQAIASRRATRSKSPCLFLDLDGFKHINDSLGHPIGDKLLQSVAERLVDCVRASDTVSRQGGDEFVVLLSEVDKPEDAAICGEADAAGGRRAPTDRRPRSPRHHQHRRQHLSRRRLGCRDADQERRHRDVSGKGERAPELSKFFKPAMNVRAVERQSIEEGLRRALERDEFALHYQPKIDLRTGAITGAEALMRWTHPDARAVSPARLHPVAEDCGLIVPIGHGCSGRPARRHARGSMPGCRR